MLQFAKLIDFSKCHTLQLMNAGAALFPVCVYVLLFCFFFVFHSAEDSIFCSLSEVTLVECQLGGTFINRKINQNSHEKMVLIKPSDH